MFRVHVNLMIHLEMSLNQFTVQKTSPLEWLATHNHWMEAHAQRPDTGHMQKAQPHIIQTSIWHLYFLHNPSINVLCPSSCSVYDHAIYIHIHAFLLLSKKIIKWLQAMYFKEGTNILNIKSWAFYGQRVKNIFHIWSSAHPNKLVL